MGKRIGPFVVLAFGVVLPSRALAVGVPTIYDNERVLPLGGRSAGMAGAYTALVCDEGAMTYNVAGLGCADASRLEVSGSAYVLQHFSVPDAFGTTQDMSTTNYHSIPAVVSGVRVLSEGDPETGVGQWAFGFGVEVPRSILLKVAPAREEEPNAVSASVIDILTRADIGVGAKLHENWSFGLSVGAGLRTYEGSFSTLVISDQQAPCGPASFGATCTEFYASQVEEELLAVGLHARAGVLYQPNEAWAFGLSVITPSLDVFGSSTVRLTDAFGLELGDDLGDVDSLYGPIVYRAKGSSKLSMPLRAALGGAYKADGFTLSADVSLSFPRNVAIISNVEQVNVRALPGLDDLDDDVLLHRTWQPNVAVGAEFEVVKDTVIDVGLFTDSSSVANEDVADGNSDRVHMFGGTVALGLLGRRARGFFGLQGQFGQGDTVVQSGELNLDTLIFEGGGNDATGRITRWSLSGFLASSYSFFPGDEDHEPPKRPRRRRPEPERAPTLDPEPEPKPDPAPVAPDPDLEPAPVAPEPEPVP